MKSYRSVALKEIWHQKLSSAFIVIALILSSAMTTAIGQSIGILDAMRVEQATVLNGDRYATFHQLDADTALAICKDEALSLAIPFITLSGEEIGGTGLNLYIREFKDNDISAYSDQYRLKEGQLPENKNEIALPENVLRYISEELEIGDTVQLPMSISLLHDTEVPFQYDASFKLTGILESEYVGYINGSVNAMVGSGTAEALLPERYQVYSVDIKTHADDDFQNIVYGLEKHYHVSDDYVQYNDLLLNAMHISYDSKNDTSIGDETIYTVLAGCSVGLLVLVAAGLVIYNILKIQVDKEVRNYGMLRAIGANRRKLYELVILKILTLSIIGLPIGSLVGLLSAKMITKMAVGFFNPDVFMVENQTELTQLVDTATGNGMLFLLSFIVTLIFALMAAFPAAWKATRISPVQSMSGRQIKIFRHKSRKIKNFEAFYARLNMKRNLGRTVLTILSLVMSIAIFIALQSFSSLLDTSTELQEMHVGDYSLTNENEGFSPGIENQLRSLEGVENISKLNYVLYQPDADNHLSGIITDIQLNPAETLQFCGMDEEWMSSTFHDLSQEQWEKIRSGQGCIIKNPVTIARVNDQGIRERDYQVGDEIVVNDQRLEVVYITGKAVGLENAGFTNGVQIITTNAEFEKLVGNDRITECYLTLSADADRQQIEAAIQDICDEYIGSRWLSYEDTDQQLKDSYAQINFLAWGIILFVGLIGLLNIVNTTYTNIYSQQREIGVQRALGMNIWSLNKVFLWEGAYYSIIATIFGALLGYACAVLIGAAVTNSLELVPIPIVSIMKVSIISIVCCLISSVLPLRKMKKLGIVECVQNNV